MKIHLLSDIHLEFGKFKHKPPACDVVVIAGDTAPGVAGLVWAANTFKPFGIEVVTIAGNHEFYNKRNLYEHYALLKKKASELGIHFLQNETIAIDGIRFVGATLWTDFALMGNQPLAMLRARNEMNDYKQIYEAPNQCIKPVTVLSEHTQSMNFLTNELSTDFSGPTVVVTHMAPSEMSSSPYFKGDPNSAFYATNLYRFVEIMKPVAWVHGHMHSSSDYMIGETRVMANPRGYVNHHGYNNDFDPNFVFEV